MGANHHYFHELLEVIRNGYNVGEEDEIDK